MLGRTSMSRIFTVELLVLTISGQPVAGVNNTFRRVIVFMKRLGAIGEPMII